MWFSVVKMSKRTKKKKKDSNLKKRKKNKSSIKSSRTTIQSLETKHQYTSEMTNLTIEGKMRLTLM